MFLAVCMYKAGYKSFVYIMLSLYYDLLCTVRKRIGCVRSSFCFEDYFSFYLDLFLGVYLHTFSIVFFLSSPPSVVLTFYIVSYFSWGYIYTYFFFFTFHLLLMFVMPSILFLFVFYQFFSGAFILFFLFIYSFFFYFISLV